MREEITTLYLNEVISRGICASELIDAQDLSKLLHSTYRGGYLTRPLFLGQSEREQLSSDLEVLHSLLMSLPDRLFDGNFSEFAHAVGMSDLQIAVIERSPSEEFTQLARADLMIDTTGFRLLEYNIGSTVGGMDNADICRGLLKGPALKEFSQNHNLTYVDTLYEQVTNIFEETKFDRGSTPVVAFVEWPENFVRYLPYMTETSNRWRAMGLDAYPCHIGELEIRDGAVWLREHRIDILYRFFLIEDIRDPYEVSKLLYPLLDAVNRDEVKIFTSLTSEVFGSKGALAMLSDERNRSHFLPKELNVIDRLVPWTRMVRNEKVVLADGAQVDLLEYAAADRKNLLLKPTLLHAGQGIVRGWDANIDAEEWRRKLEDAIDGPYVIQRRITPEPEFFPGTHGDLVPWFVVWGVFVVASGYGGVIARAVTADSGIEIINASAGTAVGCAFHVSAEQNQPRSLKE